ncbi:MAG: hypothetical protein OJF59_000122 [Cytophagales bacterium]|nr:MAG: hypothetical protein OJF59_000122 [Cytophagales bacterium]
MVFQSYVVKVFHYRKAGSRLLFCLLVATYSFDFYFYLILFL